MLIFTTRLTRRPSQRAGLGGVHDDATDLPSACRMDGFGRKTGVTSGLDKTSRSARPLALEARPLRNTARVVPFRLRGREGSQVHAQIPLARTW